MSGTPRRRHRTLRGAAVGHTQNHRYALGTYQPACTFGYQSGTLRPFANLKMDFYILGPSQSGGLPVLSELWELGDQALGVGIGLPVGNLEQTREFIRQGVEYCRGGEKRGFFFTSCGEVDRSIDLGMLRQVTEEIRQVRL